jgi:hypothetical protein
MTSKRTLPNSVVLDKCREFGISLNLKKCMSLVYSGVIFGYKVSKARKLHDPKEVLTVMNMPAQKTTKDIQVFNGMA